MDRSHIVGLTLGPQLLENGEVRRLIPQQTAPQLPLTRHEQMMKGADLPLPCRVASIADTPVLCHRLKGVPLTLPAKDVSLVNRVQGINEDERTGDRNAG